MNPSTHNFLGEKYMQRFWSKVSIADEQECWLWLASTKPSGYGQFLLNGKPAYAHRVAYELVKGAIPDGYELDHLCRTLTCVNPNHLEPVTHLENMRRGYYGAKTHCAKGHPYDDENTRVGRGRKPGLLTRHCRTCEFQHDIDRGQRRAASA